MRSLLLLIAVGAVAGWVAIKHLPASEASAAMVPRRAAVAVTAPALPPRVESVTFDGERLPLTALRDVLGTRRGDVLDVDRLAADRRALEQELVDAGYLAARVGAAEVTHSDGAAFVTFAVAQGKVFKLRSVNVTGATERDIGVLTIAPGDVAIADRIEHARQMLADHLARRGKRVQVEATMTRDAAASTVDVELAVR